MNFLTLDEALARLSQSPHADWQETGAQVLQAAVAEWKKAGQKSLRPSPFGPIFTKATQTTPRFTGSTQDAAGRKLCLQGGKHVPCEDFGGEGQGWEGIHQQEHSPPQEQGQAQEQAQGQPPTPQNPTPQNPTLGAEPPTHPMPAPTPQAVVKPSPFGGVQQFHWNKGYVKSGPPPQIPHGPKVQAPKPPTASSSANLPRPQHPPIATPLAPPAQSQAPPNQHQILEQVKRAGQQHANDSKNNPGTNIAHWLRSHPVNMAQVTQFEAAGVRDVNTLEQVLNKQTPIQGGINLLEFHDDASPFVLLSQPQETLIQGGTPAVVVGEPYLAQTQLLEEAFPGIHFLKVEELPNELGKAAGIMEKPLPRKSISPSPFGFPHYRVKSDESPKSPKPSKTPQGQPKPFGESGRRETGIQRPPKTGGPLVQQVAGGKPLPPSRAGRGEIPAQLPEGVDDLQEYFNQQSPVKVVPFQFSPSTGGPSPDAGDVGGNLPAQVADNAEELPRVAPWGEHYDIETIEDFIKRVITTGQESQGFSEEIPDDEILQAGDLEEFFTNSAHMGDIGKLTVDGKQFFYKAFKENYERENELLASRVGRLLGVPVPNMQATNIDIGGFRPTYGGAVVVSWVDGETAFDVAERFGKIYAMSILERVVQPGDADLQLFFAYILGLRDRHSENYMVSGGRLVSIDHESINKDFGSRRFQEPHKLIEYNILYDYKVLHENQLGNERPRTGMSLSGEIAGMLVRQYPEILDTYRQYGGNPEQIGLMKKRVEYLDRFSQLGTNRYGDLLKIMEEGR